MDPTSKALYRKRVMPVGDRRVFDIIKSSIVQAPYNFILDQVKPSEEWITQTELANERLMSMTKRYSRQATGGKSFMLGKKDGLSTDLIKRPSGSGRVAGQSSEEPSESSESEYSAETKQKIQHMIKTRPAIRRFLETRFDPSKFAVSISSQQMKSLILETARFGASCEGRDASIELANARKSVELGEDFLNKFALEEQN
jgi:hypothetical protein